MMKKGFTLIELLIVIAILGTLAVVILIALNPVQQLARTRDAGRISGVTQLGHAVEAWATSNSGQYLTGNANWAQGLVDAGEIATIPAEIVNSLNTPACSSNAVRNTWCYSTNGSRTAAIVFSKLESESHRSKCTTGEPYAIYSTGDSRGGVVCTTNNPSAPSSIPCSGNGCFTFVP